MTRIFAISDQHYGHQNIIKYCNRTHASAAEDRDFMIAEHNSVVQDEDLCIFVGDVCASSQGRRWLPHILTGLNGRKILVRGNHDHFTDLEYTDMGFEKVCEIMRIGDFLFCHFPDVPEVCKLAKQMNCRLVCGHTHKPFNFQDDVERVNAAVDVIGSKPLYLGSAEV